MNHQNRDHTTHEGRDLLGGRYPLSQCAGQGLEVLDLTGRNQWRRTDLVLGSIDFVSHDEAHMIATDNRTKIRNGMNPTADHIKVLMPTLGIAVTKTHALLKPTWKNRTALGAVDAGHSETHDPDTRKPDGR